MQWQIDFILEVVENAGYALKTWVQALLDTTIAALLVLIRGPRFLAYRTTSTQTIPTGTPTKVQLNAVQFDTYSAWNAGLYRFVVPRTGSYQINYSVGFRPSLSADKKYFAFVRVNNDGRSLAILHSSHNDYMGAGNAILQSLAINDYVELWCYHNSGGNVNLDYTQEMTYLSIHQLP